VNTTHPATPHAGSSSGLLQSVLAPELQHIVQALAGRTRYRYVQPLVQPMPAGEGLGWVIVSPNCSRQIDPTGGHISIAWLEPPHGEIHADTLWQLHARDHARRHWVPVAGAMSLDDALQCICQDPLGRFWP
jgi:hypothetical protein